MNHQEKVAHEPLLNWWLRISLTVLDLLVDHSLQLLKLLVVSFGPLFLLIGYNLTLDFCLKLLECFNFNFRFFSFILRLSYLHHILF